MVIMKKIGLIVFMLLFQYNYAQVGIGTTDPKTMLDVDGALSVREGTALTLVNGSNTGIDLGITPYSTYRITGPTADFEIGSIICKPGADGQIVALINDTDEDMTIVHFTGGSINRILCPDETNVILIGRYSTATFQYNKSLTHWMLIHSLGGRPVEDWSTIGNAGTTLGTNFLGTTDGVPLSFYTNNTEKLRISPAGSFRAFYDGTATLPMFSWQTDVDLDTGFYRAGEDILGFTTGGTGRLMIPNTNQLWAMASGTNSAPFYSWSNDTDSGLYRIGDNRIGFATNGTERFRFEAGGAIVNMDKNDYNFKVKTSNGENTFFVDGGNDNIGIGTNTPEETLHVNGKVRVNDLIGRTSTSVLGVTPDGTLNKINVAGALEIHNNTIIASGTGYYSVIDIPITTNGPNTRIDDLDLGVDLENTYKTIFRFTGQTNSFDITGIKGGVEGRHIILLNGLNSHMGVVNNSTASEPLNRILTYGSTATTSGQGAIEMVYDGTRWVILSLRN